MSQKVLLNAKEVNIILHRLTCQLIENHKDFSETVLIGIQPRGVYLAERIKKLLIEEYAIEEIRLGYLDITFYRDDFRTKEIPKAKETFMPYLVDNKNVIIIDDVLFTGRTVRSAMEGIMNFGRPNKIELLVLIDRKFSRHIPIEPTYYGTKVNTLTSQKIIVNLTEQGFEKDNIWITNNE